MAKKSFSVINTRRSSGGLSVINEMKKNIQIIPELKELIPPLLGDEFDQLKSNIKKEGVREPILVWEFEDDKYAIVDGHNRYQCVEELGRDTITWTVKRVEFDKIEDVREWMINNQLGRRNLTDIARSMLISEKYDLIKKGKGKSKVISNGQNLPISEKPKNAYEKLAEETGRSERSIKNDIAIAKGIKKLDKKEQTEIITGKKKVRKGDLVKLGKDSNPSSKSRKVLNGQNLPISKDSIIDGAWVALFGTEKEIVRVKDRKVSRWGTDEEIDLDSDSSSIEFLKKIKL